VAERVIAAPKGVGWRADVLQTRIAIVGAGVVGLAIAERLSRRTDQVVVLEQADAPGQGTSSRNSGVVHAGLYYPEGSLKARLCVAGNASLPAWCQSHQVPFRRVGKLVVATRDAELPALERLLALGQANGATLQSVDAAWIRANEPEVSAVAGLFSPATGIVDAHALVASLASAAVDRGVVLAPRHRVVGLRQAPGGWELELVSEGERSTLRAQTVINAAGLHADDVAALAGLEVDALGLRQTWVKGRYVRVRWRGRLAHLVYPVPAPGLVGLGVHVTLGLDGEVRLGPDQGPLDRRVEDYTVDEACLPEFLEAARRYLPALTLDALSPDSAGLRPKLLPAGRDFVVEEASAHGLPGLVNLLGLESPGLTCALELGALVAGLVERPGS
jgi:L-2-hydroxyglutarate oxidase LhgO